MCMSGFFCFFFIFPASFLSTYLKNCSNDSSKTSKILCYSASKLLYNDVTSVFTLRQGLFLKTVLDKNLRCFVCINLSFVLDIGPDNKIRHMRSKLKKYSKFQTFQLFEQRTIYDISLIWPP